MKKLRIKLFVITLLAMLAFVGVGFASWTFQNQVTTADITVTDKVAVAVEMDETFGLKAYAEDTYATEVTSLYLICDAPTVASTYMAGSGVYWAYDAAGAHPITNLYLKGQLNYDAEDGVKPLTSVTVTFTITNNLATNDYITFDNTATIGGTVVISPVADESVVAYTLVLPAVAYTTTATDISNVAGVTAMNTYLNTALSGKKIIVSAQITAKAE